MTGLLTLRDATIAGIQREMPDLKTVDAIRGALTEEGLKKISVRSPGVLVGVLGIKSLKAVDTAAYRAGVMMTAFLVTEGQNRLDRGHQLVEQLVLTIAGSTWGVPHTGLATDIDSEPIYDDRVRDKDDRVHKLSENGLFLQGVSWMQETRIERVLPITGKGRADDRAQAEALGQGLDDRVWPHEIETVIDHPKGFR